MKRYIYKEEFNWDEQQYGIEWNETFKKIILNQNNLVGELGIGENEEHYPLIQRSRKLSCRIHIEGNWSKNGRIFLRNIVSMCVLQSIFMTQIYNPEDFFPAIELNIDAEVKVWDLQKKKKMCFLHVESIMIMDLLKKINFFASLLWI